MISFIKLNTSLYVSYMFSICYTFFLYEVLHNHFLGWCNLRALGQLLKWNILPMLFVLHISDLSPGLFDRNLKWESNCLSLLWKNIDVLDKANSMTWAAYTNTKYLAPWPPRPSWPPCRGWCRPNINHSKGGQLSLSLLLQVMARFGLIIPSKSLQPVFAHHYKPPLKSV